MKCSVEDLKDLVEALHDYAEEENVVVKERTAAGDSREAYFHNGIANGALIAAANLEDLLEGKTPPLFRPGHKAARRRKG